MIWTCQDCGRDLDQSDAATHPEKCRPRQLKELVAENERLREDIRQALDHLEAVLSNDEDMPSGANTIVEADAFLERMRGAREKGEDGR